MKRYSKRIWRKVNGGEDARSARKSLSTGSEPSCGIQKSENLPAVQQEKVDSCRKDLWQVAYQELGPTDREILARSQKDAESKGHHGKALYIVDDVIEATKRQYENYRKGGLKIRQGPEKDDINLRDIAHKILNATLSFRAIVDVFVSGDQSLIASSAWGVILLGLTIAHNYHNIRKAQFESSAFLTDVLTRCAFVEKQHYHDNRYETQDQVETAIIQVYKGILRYTAQIYRMQEATMGERILESIFPITNHPLKQIESAIRSDEERLRQWVRHDEHLQQQEKAEELLGRIDELISLVKDLHRRFDLYNLPDAEGASFDSYHNQHEEECLPGTRKELLQQVSDWGASSGGPCIFWLNGMAGTGKSTISRSLSRAFQEKGQLGASYFFKRGKGDRGHAKRLISTIARQLIAAVPDLAIGVSKAIEDDPDLSKRGFRIQFEKLLLQPLAGLDDNKVKNLVIVIDALDECEEEQDIRLLLQLLPLLQSSPRVQQSKPVQLRVFITSRPELPIKVGFQDDLIRDNHRDLVLHKIARPVIEHDISLFLRHKLKSIEQTRSLPPGWPGDIEFQNLVKMSVPLFIFAATVCRVFEDYDLDPVQSLSEILEYQNEESKLDGTYLPILQRIPIHSGRRRKMIIGEFHEIVGTIIILESPLSVISLSELLGISTSAINTRLNRLHAVLNIPDNDTMPVGLFHLSFRDFLLDPETREKTEFWVDGGKAHQRVVTQCLEVMQRKLKKNICNLPYEGYERMEINAETICQPVSRLIPPELEYSCRYWTRHLAYSENPMSLMDNIYSFFQEHFLHWAEVMCVLGYASEIVGAIETVRLLVKDQKVSGVSEFLYDAKRFMLKCRRIADIAPLQLYCSGLIFAPSKSIIRRMFEMPTWMSRFPEVEESWSAEVEVIDGHGTIAVRKVAFSPDGRLLASGSQDRTIKLWDVATSTLQQTLEGHENSVITIAFSSDGRQLASGSTDNTIKIWDLQTNSHQTLTAHEDYIYSVAFSADGRWLASGSYDNTVILWDLMTSSHRTLEGHQDWVYVVAFSADGRWLASGSWDKTVKLWDPATGCLWHTLDCSYRVSSLAFLPDGRLAVCDGSVKIWDLETVTMQQTLGTCDHPQSLALSPDGKFLASSPESKPIRLWDLATGTLQQTFQGHTFSAQCVAFSPDGQLLASCALDGTIRLWDLDTTSWSPVCGEKQRTFESHGLVSSLAFSEDGRWLASGSYDDTVIIWDLNTKLWNPATNAQQRTLERHRRAVCSIAFSADGRCLASGSHDKIIKLWDPATGVLQHNLEGHEDGIRKMVFSPDGRRLVSSSDDKTIKIWDPVTGTLEYTLEGHKRGIRLLVFSPDGRWVASGSSDKTIKIWDPTTGTLQHDINTQIDFSELALTRDGLSLQTDKGIYELPSSYHTTPLDSPQTQVRVLNGEWITLQGKKILWLPPPYRSRTWITKNGLLAFGHAPVGPRSRSITLYKFCQ